MHNDNDNNSKMMWWMMIGCALPVVVLLLAGKGSGFSWLVVLAVVLMFGMHMFGMRHSKSEDEENGTAKSQNTAMSGQDNHHEH